MEPIISPWLIYLISTTDSLIKAFIFLFVTSLISLAVYGIGWCITYDYTIDHENWIKMWNKKLKYVICTYCLVGLGLVIVPTRATVIGMIVSNGITYSTIEKAGVIGKDVKNEVKQYILDIIREIDKKNDK